MGSNLASKQPFGQIVKDADEGAFCTLQRIKPCGSLVFRKEATGQVQFFWRYSIGTTSERVPIGYWDPSASPKSITRTAKGFSLAAAERAAQEMALEHDANRHQGGRPALEKRKRALQEQAAAEEQRKQQQTLRRLLQDYCDHQEAIGRESHRDARSVFKKHVLEPWGELADMPANEITAEQVADMMRRAMDQGKGRTANKLRSYMRSAYQYAKDARTKPSVPVHFKAYGVTVNPAADTAPDSTFNQPDKNPLSADEMRAYWRSIKRMPGFAGALLRLHVLTGGQRIAQLVRLKTADVSPESITLYDAKGRPGSEPRMHLVPLTAAAADALDECRPEGIYALSTDGGQTHVAATTLSKWAADAAKDIPGFTAKRIRSGVETLLAAARVSQEHRGRLQSHGISGVQARHYDAHEYLEEKAEALEALVRALEQPEPAKVRRIRFKRAA